MPPTFNVMFDNFNIQTGKKWFTEEKNKKQKTKQKRKKEKNRKNKYKKTQNIYESRINSRIFVE